MLSLALVYSVYLFFTKLILGTSSMLWYIIIAKLLNTYYNLFIIWVVILILGYNQFFYFILFYLFVNFIPEVYLFSFFSAIPKQLLIGYNSIHPSFFYSGFIFFYLYFKSWKLGYFFRSLFILTFLTIALSLGGLWGAGNSIWGFFWVNDTIELILFVLCVSLTLIIHSETTPQNIFFIKVLTLIIILWLLCLRWGFTFTRHNFFDLKKLINISVVYCFFFTAINTWLSTCFLFMSFYSFIFIVFFLVRVIAIFLNKVYNYSTYLIALHIVMFCFGLSWLKFRQNNIIIFGESVWNSFYIFNNKITSLAIYNQLFFYKPLLYKLLINYYMIFFSYCIKTYFFIQVFMSYCIIWLLVSVLFLFFKK